MPEKHKTDIIINMTELEQYAGTAPVPENGKWSELRKHRVDLTVAGSAVLWFGIWTVIKTYMTVLLNEELEQLITRLTPAQMNEVHAELLLLAILTAGMFLLHFLIYSGAVREGHGKKTGPLYLVIAFLFMAFGILNVVMTVLHVPGLADTSLISVFLDATMVVICADVLYNGIQCRKSSEKMAVKRESL